MSSDPEFVDPDDLKIKRNGDGEIVPVTRSAGSLGKVRLRPMTYGDVQEYFGEGTEVDIDSEAMAELFNEFFIRPDFDLTYEDVEDFKPLVPRDLLLALMESSGIDADVEVDSAGEASVSVDSGNI